MSWWSLLIVTNYINWIFFLLYFVYLWRVSVYYYFLPSVSIPEGGLKIDENKLKGCDAQTCDVQQCPRVLYLLASGRQFCCRPSRAASVTLWLSQRAGYCDVPAQRLAALPRNECETIWSLPTRARHRSVIQYAKGGQSPYSYFRQCSLWMWNRTGINWTFSVMMPATWGSTDQYDWIYKIDLEYVKVNKETASLTLCQ